MKKNKMTLKSKQREYGECQLCGYVGTVERHHIIPKSMNIITQKKTLLRAIDKDGILVRRAINIPIEKLMINICKKCHVLIHTEFKKYHLIKD